MPHLPFANLQCIEQLALPKLCNSFAQQARTSIEAINVTFLVNALSAEQAVHQ